MKTLREMAEDWPRPYAGGRYVSDLIESAAQAGQPTVVLISPDALMAYGWLPVPVPDEGLHEAETNGDIYAHASRAAEAYAAEKAAALKPRNRKERRAAAAEARRRRP